MQTHVCLWVCVPQVTRTMFNEVCGNLVCDSPAPAPAAAPTNAATDEDPEARLPRAPLGSTHQDKAMASLQQGNSSEQPQAQIVAAELAEVRAALSSPLNLKQGKDGCSIETTPTQGEAAAGNADKCLDVLPSASHAQKAENSVQAAAQTLSPNADALGLLSAYRSCSATPEPEALLQEAPEQPQAATAAERVDIGKLSLHGHSTGQTAELCLVLSPEATGAAADAAAAQNEGKQQSRPLLGATAATPLPPPVLSPNRAAANGPGPVPGSPQVPQQASQKSAASPSPGAPLVRCSDLLGVSDVSPLPPLVFSPQEAVPQRDSHAAPIAAAGGAHTAAHCAAAAASHGLPVVEGDAQSLPVTAQPALAAAQAVAATAQPASAAAQPASTTAQAASATAQPVLSSAQAGTNVTKLVLATTQPVLATVESGSASGQPAMISIQPGTATDESGSATAPPAADTAQDADAAGPPGVDPEVAAAFPPAGVVGDSAEEAAAQGYAHAGEFVSVLHALTSSVQAT